jgi:hypothetical protein
VAFVTCSAWDFNTNTLLTHLPFVDASYGVRLNDAGELSVTIDLADARTSSPASVIQGLGGNPFKILFHVGSQIQHAGFVYRYELDSQNMLLKLSGAGLTSALAEMVSTTTYNTSTSPAQMIATVLNAIQGNKGQNLFITPKLALSNPPAPITPNYSATQYVTAAQIIADMTAAIVPGTGGIDWWLSHAFNTAGQPVHTLNINAPRAGRDRNASGWSVDLTRAINWKWSTDAQRMGNQAIVVGAGSGGAQPKAIVTSTKGYGGLGQPPLFQQVYQFSQIPQQEQLNNIANGLVNVYGQPPAAPTVTLPVDHPTLPLGGVSIGDDVLLQAPKCQWFPNGLAQWWRVVAYKVNFPDSGVQTVEYTFNTPPVY